MKKLFSIKRLIALLVAACLIITTIINIPFINALWNEVVSEQDPRQTSAPQAATGPESTVPAPTVAETGPGTETSPTDATVDAVTQTKDSIEILTERIKASPSDSALYIQRAAYYYSLSQYANAVKDYTAALEIKPDPQTSYLRATVYTVMGEYQSAYYDLTDAIKADPDNIDYISLMADTCNALSKYEEALKHLKTLILDDGSNPILYTLAADACVYLGDFETAAQYYLGAITRYSDEAQSAGIELSALYAAYGNSLKTVEQYQEAADAYSEAIALSENKELYFQRGFCLVQLESYTAAIEDFTKSIDLGYETVISSFQRGLCYYATKSYSKAIADFKVYEEANPESTDTFLYMGLSYQALKKYTSAIRYYKKSIAAGISEGDCNFNIGNCYYNQGEYEQAIPYYTKAISAKAQLYPALLNRGVAYIKLNKYNEAKADLKRVIDECRDSSLVQTATTHYDPIKNITIITG